MAFQRRTNFTCLPHLGFTQLIWITENQDALTNTAIKFKYRAKVYDAQGAHLGRWAWDVFFVTQ
jgi:hypothetical protein